jgi:hypothetical protein
MRSLRTFALSLLAGATAFASADDQTSTLPPLPQGKVLCVVVPRDARREKPEVDFQFADGQTVTVVQGKPIDGEWRLDKTEWSRDGKQAVITFRHGKQHRGASLGMTRELRVSGDLVARNGTQRTPRALVEVQSRFYEVPVPNVGRVQLALETAPAEDRLACELLRNALDADARPILLTAAQFETLSQFLAANVDVDVIESPGVTTKSGQRAVIETIREFRYPVEWETDVTAVEPAATAFETRNCGLTMEIEPTLKHGPLLELEMTPQIVEFLGAEDLDNAAAYPYKPAAKHLPERALNLLDKVPFTVARPARYVFSARVERALLDVPPGYGVLLTGLTETEKIAPFEKAAPHGQLIVLVKVDVVAK